MILAEVPSNGGSFRICGLPIAVERYKRYEGSVFWEHHSDYFGHQIERAYHHKDGKPCALYRIMIRDMRGYGYLTAVNLSGIKHLFKCQVIE